MYAGYFAADAGQQFFSFGCGNMATHVGQYRVGYMLQCYVEIFAHITVARHYRQYVVGELRRIGIVQANPFHARNLSHAVDESGQTQAAAGEVTAIGRQVLGDYVEFLYAAADEFAYFLQNLLFGA